MMKSRFPLPEDNASLEGIDLSQLNNADYLRIFKGEPQRIVFNIEYNDLDNLKTYIIVYKDIFYKDEDKLRIGATGNFYSYTDELCNQKEGKLDCNYPILGFKCNNRKDAVEIKRYFEKRGLEPAADENPEAGTKKESDIVFIGKSI